eukprot:2901585-Rhodomonas_salina.3
MLLRMRYSVSGTDVVRAGATRRCKRSCAGRVLSGVGIACYARACPVLTYRTERWAYALATRYPVPTSRMAEGHTPLGGGCVTCDLGTYKEAIGNASCLICPPGSSTSETASLSLDSCLCAAGLYLNSTESASESACVPCDEGYFCMGLSGPADMAHVLCDPGTWAPARSTRASDCQCQAGHEPPPTGSGPGCSACVEGTYKGALGPAPCTPCPEGTFLGAKMGLSVEECELCPVGSASEEGSGARDACTCVEGFEW